MQKSEKSACQGCKKLLALVSGGTDKYFPAGCKTEFICPDILTTNSINGSQQIDKV